MSKLILAYFRLLGVFAIYFAFLFGIPLLACLGLGWLFIKFTAQTWVGEGLVIFGASIIGARFWRWWISLFNGED